MLLACMHIPTARNRTPVAASSISPRTRGDEPKMASTTPPTNTTQRKAPEMLIEERTSVDNGWIVVPDSRNPVQILWCTPKVDR
jgi:hypothetical protein